MAVPRYYFSIKISTVRERLERPQTHTAVLNLVPEGHNESTYSCLHSLNLVLLNSNLVVLVTEILNLVQAVYSLQTAVPVWPCYY